MTMWWIVSQHGEGATRKGTTMELIVALGRVAGQRSTKTLLQGRYELSAMDEQMERSAGEEAGWRL
jgi:hypothetical protein